MEVDLFSILGKIAGIGGLSLGVVLLIFRKIIQKDIFPKLTKNHSFKIIKLTIIAVWSIGVFGIIAWLLNPIIQPNSRPTILTVDSIVNRDSLQRPPTYSVIINGVRNEDFEKQLENKNIHYSSNITISYTHEISKKVANENYYYPGGTLTIYFDNVVKCNKKINKIGVNEPMSKENIINQLQKIVLNEIKNIAKDTVKKK